MMARKSLRIGERGEVHTRQLDHRLWKARCYYKDFDGKRKEMSRTGRTKGAATGKLNDAWLEYSQRILSGRRGAPSTITVNQLFDEWTEYEWKRCERKGYPSARTLRNRHSVMKNHALPRIGEVMVSELTIGGLNDLLTDIPQPDGKYLATTVQVKAALVTFCQYAVTHNLLSTNIARELEAVGYQPPEPRPLSAEEIARIRVAVARWQASKPNIRVPVLDVIDFMLGTGCRLGEALGIQWQYVHLNDPVPWVRIEFAVVYDRHNPSALGRTKAKKILHIALPIFAAEMLYRRWAAAGYPDEGLVFHRRSGKAYSQGEINAAGRRALRDHVIVDAWDGGFKSHALRKSVLNSVNDQFGVDAAAEQGGHSSVSTTKKYYLAPNVKTINYTESLHLLLGMDTPVLAEPQPHAIGPGPAAPQQEWIPSDVRRVAEAILRGEVPDGVIINAPGGRPAAELTDGNEDELIVDEAPAPDERDEESTQMDAQQHWQAAKQHSAQARSRDANGGGVVVIDNDTQTYQPLKRGRKRVVSTQHLRRLKTPRATIT